MPDRDQSRWKVGPVVIGPHSAIRSTRPFDPGADEILFSVAGSPTAPREARHAVAARTEREIDGAVLEVVLLLLSEIVTNCVRHAGAGDGRPIDVAATIGSKAMRVEVCSAGPGFEREPRRLQRGEAAHGLDFVEALSESWGIDPGPPPLVWFEVSLDPADTAQRWLGRGV